MYLKKRISVQNSDNDKPAAAGHVEIRLESRFRLRCVRLLWAAHGYIQDECVLRWKHIVHRSTYFLRVACVGASVHNTPDHDKYAPATGQKLPDERIPDATEWCVAVPFRLIAGPEKCDSGYGFPCHWPCAACWSCASSCWPWTSLSWIGSSTNTTSSITNQSQTPWYHLLSVARTPDGSPST